MRLFPPEPSIAEDEGFDSNKDIFGYSVFGSQLKELVSRFDDSLVGVLDAPWGSGKSTFIKMWCGEMRRDGYPVIYFDAFKNDYTDDPIVALAGEVIALADKKDPKGSLAREEFLQNAVEVLLAGELDTKHGLLEKALQKNGASTVAERVKEATMCSLDGLKTILKNRLEARVLEKQAFSNFKHALAQLSTQIGKEDDSTDSLPLIFVIDELDRCRPPFALALLEKIKHLFSVPHVKFLLVTNLDQLSKVVKSEYGQEIAAELYLQKFYDVVFSLPLTNPFRHTTTREIFCNYIIVQCQSRVINEVLLSLSEHFQLDLRSMLKVHAYAASVVGKQGFGYCHTQLMVGLACMRLLNQSLFYKAVKGTLGQEDISSFFRGDSSVVEDLREVFNYGIGIDLGQETREMGGTTVREYELMSLCGENSTSRVAAKMNALTFQ